MEVNELLTLAGAAIVVTILTEVIKRALALTEEAVTRFGPLISVVLGVAVTVGAGITQGADLVSAALTGLLAGASASGIYSYTKVR